jgi:undecaprenyl-diphosphatase
MDTPLSPLQAFMLGIVQALTEFLPISSSGHLILLPALLGWPEQGLAFDVALHLGTAVALLAYFWRDWTRLALAGLAGIASRDARGSTEWKLLWLLILGCVPAGLAGVLFEDAIEDLLRSPIQIAALMIVFGLVLLVAERRSSRDRPIASLTWRDALAVGAAQALALAPGVSRSGVTLSAALLLGMRRADAARFSFLLGTPLVLAAGLFEGVKLVRTGVTGDERTAFAIGMVTSALVGLVVIWGLLAYLQRHSTAVFVGYRVLVGALAIAYFSSVR